MQKLDQKNCVSCAAGVEPLDSKEAEILLKNIPDWKIELDGQKPLLLKREYKFKNFKTALEFVNRVGEIAEQQKHHPDIKLGWGYVSLQVQTHNINGLHENDFILAAKIDQI